MPENPPNGKTSRDNSKPTPLTWFKFRLDDYLRKTRGLSVTEHGAYFRMLLMFYQDMGEPLPLDSTAVCREIVALTPDEQAAVETILQRYWRQTDAGYVNDTALEVIAEWVALSQMRRKSGAKGGRPKKRETTRGPETRVGSGRKPNANQMESKRKPKQKQIEIERENKKEIDKPQNTYTPPTPSKPSEQPAVEPGERVCDRGDINELLETILKVYPETAGTNEPRTARAIADRLQDGYSPDDLVSAAKRYTRRCEATGQWSMRAQNFYGEAANVDDKWLVPTSKADRAEQEQQRVLDDIRTEARNGDRKPCPHRAVIEERGVLVCAACREVMEEPERKDNTMSEQPNELTVEPVGTGDTRECEHPGEQCKIVSMTDLDGHSGMYALCRVCGGAVEVSKGDDGEWWPADGATMQRAAVGYMEAIG